VGEEILHRLIHDRARSLGAVTAGPHKRGHHDGAIVDRGRSGQPGIGYSIGRVLRVRPSNRPFGPFTARTLRPGPQRRR
jgi:hypothetical protein